MVCRNLSAFADAPRAGSAEAKDLLAQRINHCISDAPRAGSAEAKKRSHRRCKSCPRCTPCRQRRGKVLYGELGVRDVLMHPVQAAPRQRDSLHLIGTELPDAPRAGSAEAKSLHQQIQAYQQRCTPCRQRRGKGRGSWCCCRRRLGCTPCRQRRGKVEIS